MATDADFIAYVADQAGLGPLLSTRKMFGEYALYVHGKVVALVCDNRVYLKPTEPGRALLSQPQEAPPYPGARMHWCLGDELDDRALLARLLLCTAEALPLPNPKKPAAPRGAKPAVAAKKPAVRKPRPA